MLADALFKAYKDHQALDKKDFDGLLDNDASAYRVQRQLTDLKDQRVGGYKVSLTSEETQKMFSADSPLYGAQVESHFLPSPAEMRSDSFMDALVEVEMLFTAKEDLSSSDSLEDLMHKTKVAAAMELPDSRFSNWFPSLSKYMVMADAAVGGYVLFGQEVDTDKLFDRPEQLAEVRCDLFCNGKHLKEGTSAEVLGNPLNSLHWLAGKLEEQGNKLRAGQRVSSGTFLLPEHLSAGNWRAAFDHGLGSVLLNLEK